MKTTSTRRVAPAYFLRMEHYTVNVPSDNAMIDSGYRTRVYVWLKDAQVVDSMEYCTGRGAEVSNEFPKAPEDIMKKAAAYEALLKRLTEVTCKIYDAEKTARSIATGSRVEVFKGRKAPKGEYTVLSAGKSDYGPYFNLQGADGKIHRYINPDNCRSLESPKYPALMVPETLPLLIHLARKSYYWRFDSYNADSDTQLTIFAIADALETAGYPNNASILRAHAAWFTGNNTREESLDAVSQ